MAKAQTVRSRARSSQRTVVADDAPVDPALPQKKRARHRLIGAIVLCVAAAVLVPLLLEPEPARPLSDLSVVIPPKTTSLPSRSTEPRADLRPDAARRDAKAPEPSASDKPTELPKSEMPKPAETRSADTVALEAAPAAVPADGASRGSLPGDADRSKPAASATSAASSSSQSTAPAIAAAAASPAPTTATDSGKQTASKPGGKYLIQVGAFSSDSAATAALERIQGAGLRGFTEKIKTDRGERIRVRAGPFSTRDAAEQAREKLKATGLEAALIAPS
jgi:DedD protein